MTAELKEAFMLTAGLGPAVCLITFMPLWAAEFLLPAARHTLRFMETFGTAL